MPSFLPNAPAKLAAVADVEALLEMLRSSTRRDRASAAYYLRQFPRPRVEEALIDALGDSTWIVREAALQSLIHVDAHRPPEPIVQALRRAHQRAAPPAGDPDVRELLEFGLWRLRALQPAERLADALNDGSFLDGDATTTRVLLASAADALAELGGERAIAALANATGHEDRFVRLAATKALGRTRDAQAIPHLIVALNSDDKAVRVAAIRGLRHFDEADAVEALRELRPGASKRERWAAWRARSTVRRRTSSRGG